MYDRGIQQLTSAVAVCCFVLLAAALAWGGGASAAGPTGPDEALKVAKGRVTFRVYCSNCHGEEGRGDGKLAELLKIPPADLTRIASDNGGVFPRDAVLAVIDGREEVRGHGEREMPIWGDAFKLTLRPIPGDATDEERAQEKIDDVASYLRTLQATP